jgi:3-oxoacyl-[acyl-carrier-protein] synthase III
MMGTVILGTGSSLPKRIMTNKDLEAIVDTDDAWIHSRTGIKNRRIGGAGEQTHELAAAASREALKMAGLSAEELDIIVVGTISSHMLMPSSACFVQMELGATNAFAYDINAACSGFIYGLDMADKYIRAQHNKKILVIGAETLSSRLNWNDRNTCILFGDGAGAAVLGHSDDKERGVIGSNHRSDGRLWKLLHMHAPPSTNPDLEVMDNTGSHIIMEGREVFKYAVRAMEDSVRGLLQQENISMDSIKLFIPHQANMRILNNLLDRLGFPEEKVFFNVSEYGNTSAASVPIALDEAHRQGLFTNGDIILLCAFGGGFTWGASLIKW